MSPKDRFHCQNPNPTKGGTNIPRWKYEAVRDAIITVLAEFPDGVEFKPLPSLVRGKMSAADLEALGSVSWHTTVVKLHLEAVSEIERVAGKRPQMIRIARADTNGGLL